MTGLLISQIIIDDPTFHLRDLDADTVRRYAEVVEQLLGFLQALEG